MGITVWHVIHSQELSNGKLRKNQYKLNPWTKVSQAWGTTLIKIWISCNDKDYVKCFPWGHRFENTKLLSLNSPLAARQWGAQPSKTCHNWELSGCGKTVGSYYMARSDGDYYTVERLKDGVAYTCKNMPAICFSPSSVIHLTLTNHSCPIQLYTLSYQNYTCS